MDKEKKRKFHLVLYGIAIPLPISLYILFPIGILLSIKTLYPSDSKADDNLSANSLSVWEYEMNIFIIYLLSVCL